MIAGGNQLVTFVQGRLFRSTNDKILLPQAQITPVRGRVIYRERFVLKSSR